ncbi:MAG: butyrate kinase [Bacteroidetes bacterium]|nr:butyrate kinase [Bacteroidota bacterium]MBT4400246.1 butyrate kinase [Bacteroidota bacterium]MBT4409780.1 butyrate kinase [Bacteroidota bacterium]MBT7093327.1 butyrate kinase [Bacteroidota bacterium]MBT7465671.1 butyrate kinase [Bacteroidota bacterium]
MSTQTSFQSPLILAIHPRIPFTNIGIFRNQQMMFLKKVSHPKEEVASFRHYTDQTEYRVEKILNELKGNDIPLNDIKVIIGRGGLIRPVKAGIYKTNQALLDDLSNGIGGEDVVNLSGLLAHFISEQIEGSQAFVADPVVVDEFDDIARISGHPDLVRRSVFHALEQKSVARKFAKTTLKKYEDLNLIVAQMGNGITIGAHHKGRVIDANQGLDGDGPFSPTRSGNLPMGDLIKLCFSGKKTKDELTRMITTEGGLFAYLGTHDGYIVDNMARNGDEKAKFLLEAMAYQAAKTIGSMYAVLKGQVDAILLTGGLTQSRYIMDELLDRIKPMGTVHIYSSEDDVETLALNGYYILQGDLEPMEYKH